MLASKRVFYTVLVLLSLVFFLIGFRIDVPHPARADNPLTDVCMALDGHPVLFTTAASANTIVFTYMDRKGDIWYAVYSAHETWYVPTSGTIIAHGACATNQQ
jgi:hypothetical protein